MATIEMGDRVKCKVSGFTGIAVGRTEWINKCVRFAVQPEKMSKEGKPMEAVWHDVEQLELIKKGVIIVDKTVPVEKRPNGPRSNPQRSADPTR